MQRGALLLLWFAAAVSAGCHPGPVFNPGAYEKVGGTIAGIVTAADATTTLTGRRVTAIEAATRSTYETTTAANGGYTLKVPTGTYHLDVELHAGELVRLRPDDVHITNGDLDAHRDFIITA